MEFKNLEKFFDSDMMDIHNQVIECINKGDDETLLTLYPEILKRTENKKSMADYNAYMAYEYAVLLNEQDKLDECKTVLEKLQKNVVKYNVEFLPNYNILSMLSTICLKQGIYADALNYINNAYKDLLNSPRYNEYDEATFLQRVANCLLMVNDNDKAFKKINRALNIYDKYKNDDYFQEDDYIEALYTLMACYTKNKDANKAIEVLDKLLMIYKKDIKHNLNEILYLYQFKNDTFFDIHDNDKAKALYDEFEKFAEDNDLYGDSRALDIFIDSIMFKKDFNNLDEAVALANKVITKIRFNQNVKDKLGNIYIILSDIYEDKKDKENVIKYLKEAKAIFDQIKDNDCMDYIESRLSGLKAN